MTTHNYPTPGPAPGAAPAAPPGGAGAGLGKIAKSPATSIDAGCSPMAASGIDPETGEISGLRDPADCRVERFILQSAVRNLMPGSRTAKCLRYCQKQRSSVDVWRSTQYKRAFYGGLQTCASVWACPVCSAKISERRRTELKTLIAAHQAAGGVVLLVTRTVPHDRQDDLADLLDRIAQAERSYTGHRDYKTLMQSFGLVGKVRALEVTHGEANGWHPHVHELVFLASGVSIPDLEEDLSRIWKGAAVRAGLRLPSRAHGLSVQDGSQAAKYASKWGLESELTQWHRKRGKVESRTPFDLLRAVVAEHDGYAGYLFREYADAFHGRRQLVFSRGLKARYQVADLDDGELAARQDADAVLLGRLTLDQWRVVCKTEQRGALLEIAANFTWESVLLLVESLERALERMSSA